MFYALNNQGEKIPPIPGATATCPCCESAVIAKTGNIKQHHWAHKSLVDCDGWYEMTSWHLQWQELFPLECREVVMRKGDDKHRADVKIGNLIIEFQHSGLSSLKVRERESFYGSDGNKLIWIIDGTGKRVWQDWQQQLAPELLTPVFLTDKDSKIYFELVGYYGIPIIRKLSLPISLVVNPRYPTFVDLGDYVACPTEVPNFIIDRIVYAKNWGHQSGSKFYIQKFILIKKDSFVESLYHLPTDLNNFKTLKFCDKETLSKREECIEIARRKAEEAREELRKKEEFKKQREELRKQKEEQRRQREEARAKKNKELDIYEENQLEDESILSIREVPDDGLPF